MPKGAGRPPRANAKRRIEHYTHVGKDRANNPPVGLVTPETDREAGNKAYAYDPHIDPALQWAGKAERTSFEIPIVSLHVHERIDPRSIIEAVRKKNGEDFVQGSLFSRRDETPPIREAVEFYKHKHNWSILGSAEFGICGCPDNVYSWSPKIGLKTLVSRGATVPERPFVLRATKLPNPSAGAAIARDLPTAEDPLPTTLETDASGYAQLRSTRLTAVRSETTDDN